MATSASVVPILDAAIVHEVPSLTADSIAADLAQKSGIRVVSPSEYKEVARCLAEAFREDHVVRYGIDAPDRAHWSEEQKYKLFTQLFEYIVYASCLKGLVTTVGPNYDCCALWNPPGVTIDDFFTRCRSGLWRLVFQLSWQGIRRWYGEFVPLMSGTFVDVMGDRRSNTWLLTYVGTKVGSRGNGYARKLIEHVSAMADHNNQPLYLESSHDVNILIYNKLGFEVRKPIYLGEGEDKMRLDIMVREPHTVKTEKKREKMRAKKHFGAMGFKDD